MSHSLRAKLRCLRYKGILENKDYKRLCHALDLEKAEQEPIDEWQNGYDMAWEEAKVFYEKEPCDDVVSRQAVLDCATLITSIPTEDWDIGDWVCLFRDRVKQLPSVQPTMKTDDFAKKFIEYLKKENR